MRNSRDRIFDELDEIDALKSILEVATYIAARFPISGRSAKNAFVVADYSL